jgi:hypothetical protein
VPIHDFSDPHQMRQRKVRICHVFPVVETIKVQNRENGGITVVPWFG